MKLLTVLTTLIQIFPTLSLFLHHHQHTLWSVLCLGPEGRRRSLDFMFVSFLRQFLVIRRRDELKSVWTWRSVHAASSRCNPLLPPPSGATAPKRLQSRFKETNVEGSNEAENKKSQTSSILTSSSEFKRSTQLLKSRLSGKKLLNVDKVTSQSLKHFWQIN